jgi:hypothetical protein
MKCMPRALREDFKADTKNKRRLYSRLPASSTFLEQQYRRIEIAVTGSGPLFPWVTAPSRPGDRVPVEA